MAHMKPQAVHMTAVVVETDSGTEVVDSDLIGSDEWRQMIAEEEEPTDDTLALLGDYCDGKPRSYEVQEPAWYGRLSAPGYLDGTGWDGPHDSERAAIMSQCELYEVDPDGEDASDAREVTFTFTVRYDATKVRVCELADTFWTAITDAKPGDDEIDMAGVELVGDFEEVKP